MCWSTSITSATPSFIVTASGWAPPMPPAPAVMRERAGERAAEPLASDLGEALVRALQDSLRADVDPRSGGHLPVHREALVFEAAELVPVRPIGHQVGVGDQHPRRPLVGAHDADRLARLDEHRLVALERGERAQHRPVRIPRTGGAARCRRRRRAGRGSRPPRDRGCSAASGTPPPAASRDRSGRCRAALGCR